MIYPKWAIAVAMAGGLSVAAAKAQTNEPKSVTAVSYAYGNYDYYNSLAGEPTPAKVPENQPPAPVPSPPVAAAPSCSAAQNTDSSGGSTSSGSCAMCYRNRLGCWLFDCHDDCPLECCNEEPYRCFDCCTCRDRGISIYGWADGGIMGNTQSPRSPYNGPVTFPDRDDGQFNQLYGVIERTAPCNNIGWFLGGRVDMLYGSDFIYTTAAGLDGTPVGNSPRWGNSSFQYGAAMPQLYVETDYDDLKIKWGHFYTIIGYESVPAVNNFFYTHSYTEQYGEPFTHTGILASRPWNDNWTVYAGSGQRLECFRLQQPREFPGRRDLRKRQLGQPGVCDQHGQRERV